MEYHKSRSRNV